MIRDLIEIIGFPFFLVSYSSLSFRMVCGWAVPYITLGLNLNKQSAACPPGWKSYVILPESLSCRHNPLSAAELRARPVVDPKGRGASG
jgi:hypothetical protein